MFCSRSGVLLGALLLASCARRQPEDVQRLAILRFENLSSDPSADWIGRALADIVTTELSGSPSVYAIPSARLHLLNQAMGPRPIAAPGVSAEAPLAYAAGATRVGYGEYAIAGGKLRARLTIEDARTRRIAGGPFEATAPANDPVAAATALARQVAQNPQPYGTTNAAAVEAYVRGVETGDAAAIRRYAEQAIAADPNFGQGYVALVETAIKQQDRAGAAGGPPAPPARGPAIAPAARIRLELLSAGLRGDIAARERALGAMAQAAPLDPTVWRAIAESAASRRDHAQAVAAYTKALAIEPEDASTWNQLGYTAAAAGNLEAAVNALRRYQSLRPNDPNPLDSLGDVNLMFGRLREAEGLYLEAHKKNPAFLNGGELYKAAVARLMTGDVAGANAILGDRAATADWLWLTGRRKEAYEKLSSEGAGNANPEARARSLAQLAIWAALLNQREAADRLATQAASTATAATAGAVAVSRFVTLPSAPAPEWAARAERLFPNPAAAAIKEFALATALLLDRHFADAVPLLRRMETRAGNSGDRSAAIELAWSLVETGKVQEAAPLLRMNPVPGVDSGPAFIGLYFPRLFQLRAIVAEREGRADEARENRRIYAALGGV